MSDLDRAGRSNPDPALMDERKQARTERYLARVKYERLTHAWPVPTEGQVRAIEDAHKALDRWEERCRRLGVDDDPS